VSGTSGPPSRFGAMQGPRSEPGEGRRASQLTVPYTAYPPGMKKRLELFSAGATAWVLSCLGAAATPICEHAAPPPGCAWQAGPTCDQDRLVCSTRPGNHHVSLDFSTMREAVGEVPLTVSFSYSRSSSAFFRVDFGDGQGAEFEAGGCPKVGQCPCRLPHVDHTYPGPGIYAAKLRNPLSGCGNDPECNVIGRATVLVR